MTEEEEEDDHTLTRTETEEESLEDTPQVWRSESQAEAEMTLETERDTIHETERRLQLEPPETIQMRAEDLIIRMKDESDPLLQEGLHTTLKIKDLRLI